MKLSSLPEFDAAEAIQSTEALAAYLRLAFETESTPKIKRALRTGARGRGLTSLEAALQNEEPLTLKLTLYALEQLGMKLTPFRIREHR